MSTFYARKKEVGSFNLILFNDLRNDENNFFDYFRMSSASFDVLHGKLKEFKNLYFNIGLPCTKVIKNSAII